ncbi:glycosyltransferase family 2 protein [Flavobacterium sp.]|uniref:glycosyltransferase family 2 protein n=1 Tax=Flavobacterium sp. TaxID=239 RepID=UPI0026161270|nr:glycosyltransferase family 2 protein [Flavobacterium sp.]
MNNIKVSIIIATYNRGHFIFETLKSIVNQSFKEFECIIVDDDGTDNTFEVIKPILDSDSRFSFHRRPSSHKKGLPGTRNYGISIAKGEYVIFFDDDDIIHPENLQTCVNEFKNSEIDFCKYDKKAFFGEFDYVFENALIKNRTKFDVKNIQSLVDNSAMFASCVVMWKKECFLNNLFNENLMYAEEWELYPRIISNGFSGITIDTTLYYNRKHDESNTGQFWSFDSVRRNSKNEAVKLVFNNLKKKDLLTFSITSYLVSLAFFLKEKSLLDYILSKSDFTVFRKMYIKLKYYIYPFVKVIKRKLK